GGGGAARDIGGVRRANRNPPRTGSRAPRPWQDRRAPHPLARVPPWRRSARFGYNPRSRVAPVTTTRGKRASQTWDAEDGGNALKVALTTHPHHGFLRAFSSSCEPRSLPDPPSPLPCKAGVARCWARADWGLCRHFGAPPATAARSVRPRLGLDDALLMRSSCQFGNRPSI